jgi:hypothetical protein
MKRRDFITLIGGALAWPIGVRAQQTTLPLLGLLSSVAFNTRRDQVAGFHRGLQEAGYVQGKNVAIEYRPKAPCFVHIHGGYWQRNLTAGSFTHTAMDKRQPE